MAATRLSRVDNERGERMLLEDMKQILGTEQSPQSQETCLWTGVCEEFGSSSPFRLQFDSEGRFIRTTEGPLGLSVMYDGEVGWRVDWSGMSAPLEMATLEHEQIEILIMTGAWLARPGTFEVLAVSDSAGSEALGSHEETDNEVTLTLRLKGGKQLVDLVVDGDTKLPIRLKLAGIAGETLVSFEEYETSKGLCWPRRIVRTMGGHVERVLTIERAVRLEPGDQAERSYSARPDLPEDTTFSTAAGDVPIRTAPTGHVLVQPEVNGRKSDWFIFDTGAGSSGVGTTSPARDQLEQIGTALVGSIFGTQATPVLRGSTFGLGPLSLKDPTFCSMDLDPLEEFFGEPVAGIVGFDLLSRSVVELDLAEQRMTLHDPKQFDPDEENWQKLWFQDNHPVVEAQFNGRRGLFRLDIGAAGGPHGNIVFHGPAVKAYDLIDPDGAETIQLGNQTAAVGTLESFELAGRRFDELPVAYALDATGIFSDPCTTGNVGVGILQSFRIVFDYQQRRVSLTPKP